jgi:hypothetical protein
VIRYCVAAEKLIGGRRKEGSMRSLWTDQLSKSKPSKTNLQVYY